MITAFKNFLTAILPFSDDELVFFLMHLKQERLKKGQLFLQEGAVSEYVGFLMTGAVRAYYTVGNKEVVTMFFLAGEWFGEYGSFLGQKPSTYNVQALDDCDVYLLSYENIQKMYDSGKIWERYGRMVAEKLFIDALERQYDYSINPPDKRYLTLLEKQPQLLNHVPLKYVAQYLNVEPETLSRIRKRLATKNKE